MKRLEIWTGPVSAAKSEGAYKTIRRLQRQRSKKHPEKNTIVLHVRPIKSQREEEPAGFAQTKDGNKFPCVYIEKIQKIKEVLDNCAEDPDIIWLDEIHFWEFHQLNTAYEYFPEVGKIVQELRENYMFFISGISASTKLNPICPSMGYLLQLADKIHHEYGDCDWCGGFEIASRSVFIGGGEQTGDIQLGGEESFRPACPECWNSLQNLSPRQIIELLKH